MADIIDVFFILSVIGTITITLLKLYNTMSFGKLYQIKDMDNTKKYNLKMPIILLVLFIISFFFGLISVMTSYSIFYVQMFKFEIALVLLNVLFFIIELFYFLQDTTKNAIKGRYNSQNARN